MSTSPLPVEQPASLDLRGMTGPLVTTSAYHALQRLPTGAVLVVLTDDPPAPAVLVESFGSCLRRITMRR